MADEIPLTGDQLLNQRTVNITGPQEQTSWSDMINRALKHPDAPFLLMQLGSQLMQPLQPGQTPAGHIGQGLGTAMGALAAVQNRRKNYDLQERRVGAEERRADLAERELDIREGQAIGDEQATTRRLGLEEEKLKLARGQLSLDQYREKFRFEKDRLATAYAQRYPHIFDGDPEEARSKARVWLDQLENKMELSRRSGKVSRAAVASDMIKELSWRTDLNTAEKQALVDESVRLVEPFLAGDATSINVTPTENAPMPPPVAPGQIDPTVLEAVQSLPVVKTRVEYDNLPAGSRYLDPNGILRIKGGM